jgi:hypothetical protein
MSQARHGNHEIRQGQKNGEAQFLARGQQLEVPDFFFLPAHGAVEKDSLLFNPQANPSD